MELIGVLVEKVPRKGETHFSHFTNLDTVRGLNGSETTAHIICGFDQADITTGLDEVESQNHIGDATTDKRDREVGTLRYKKIGMYFATDDGEATISVDSYRVVSTVPSMTGQ